MVKNKIIAIPLNGSAYTEALYKDLALEGFSPIEGKWKFSWIKEHLDANGIVHIHWPSYLYTSDRGTLSTIGRWLKFIGLAFWISQNGRLWWTAHNLYPHESKHHKFLDWAIRKITIRLGSTVFVHGDHAKALIEHEFGKKADKFVKIPHGHWIDHTPPCTSKQKSRAILNIPTTASVILFAGQCRPYKNIELLIKSFNTINNDNTLLIIAGKFNSKEYQNHIEKLASANSRIILKPHFIESEEMALLYSACDVSCAPYKEILTSGSAMMSLSYGRPFVSIDRGFLREVISAECGQLVSQLSEHDLSACLQQALNTNWDESKIINHAKKFSFRIAARKMHERARQGK